MTATYGGDAAHVGSSASISLHIITLGTAPLISSLEIPSSLLAAPSGPALNSRRVFGTTVRYTLRAPSLVRFTVQTWTVGRKGRGGRCVVPNRRNLSHYQCARFVTQSGSFTLIGSKGQNHFRLTGRIGGKSLTPGSYRLVATPSILGVSGRPAMTTFQIKRPKRRV